MVEGGDLGMVGLPKLVALSFCVGSQLGCEPVSGGAGAVQFLSRMIPVLAQPPAPAALLPLASRSSQSSLVSRQRHVLDRLAEGRHSRGRECLGQDDATHVNPFAIRQPRFIILTPIPRVPCRKSLHGFAPQCANRLPFAPTTPSGSCVRPSVCSGCAASGIPGSTPCSALSAGSAEMSGASDTRTGYALRLSGDGALCCPK